MKRLSLIILGLFSFIFSKSIAGEASKKNLIDSCFSYRVGNDSVIEVVKYFSNKKNKSKTILFIVERDVKYKTIKNYYRKNGMIRNSITLDFDVNPLVSIKYNKQGKIIFEKHYTYNFKGTLISIGTTRNGETKYNTFDVDLNGDPIYNNY